ncbi:hypothetical protein ELG72_37300 [Rhizobium leguminosarum]|nr:hypothetical protein ELG82_38040 [Rhizobium leguminosarum]TBG06978.1 hypothetical protein ELG80_37815 [Rhizobium leguminosarum]TBG07849.1 hypothetical protein ELG81_37200 [Rhizobium leguminosarum]TBG30015.1 hypothetical protein ELG75_37885 [Rhizobium leguminosarum]TBG50148.1 hypothetical protein ELG72_37300 [Rhizobium leguminosarum]
MIAHAVRFYFRFPLSLRMARAFSTPTRGVPYRNTDLHARIGKLRAQVKLPHLSSATGDGDLDRLDDFSKPTVLPFLLSSDFDKSLKGRTIQSSNTKRSAVRLKETSK